MNWNIVALDVAPLKNGLQDVIYQVHWRVSKKDEDHTDTMIGCDSVPDPDPSVFTPIEEIDKDTVLGWLQDVMGEERLAQMEQGLDQQLEEKRNPSSVTIRPDW